MSRPYVRVRSCPGRRTARKLDGDAPPPHGAAAPLAPVPPALTRAATGFLSAAPPLSLGLEPGHASPRALEALPPTRIPELTRTEPRDAEGWRRAALPAVETFGLNLTMMGWNRWIGESRWAHVTWDTIGANLRHEWVRDDDNLWINNIGHPYMGTYAQTAARSAGLGFWASALYPVAMSAQWELAGETEPPSINDQVTTSIAGIVLGEALFRFSDALRAEGGPWRNGAAALLSPFGAVNARYVRRAPRPAPELRWQLATGAVSGDATGAGWAGAGGTARAWTGFSVVWGLPGDPELDPSQPFDHFVLESGYEAAGDPAATLRARGLVLGEGVEWGEATRGLWGMFLSYDFDTTGPYRVSTTAVGVGASTRTDLGRGLGLEGTAIASAVLMGGAGNLAPARPEARDYRLGPGEQVLLEARLVSDAGLAGGVALRQYLVVGDGPGNGAEVLVEGSAKLLWWLTGPHAIGAEFSQHLRRSGEEGTAGRAGSEGVVRLYYALAKG